jgi:hypothetical protein
MLAFPIIMYILNSLSQFGKKFIEQEFLEKSWQNPDAEEKLEVKKEEPAGKRVIK